MREVKIPDNISNPFEVSVNNKKYKYPAGATVNVPDEVAEVIEAVHNEHQENVPEKTNPPFASGSLSWHDLEGKPFSEEVKCVYSETITFAAEESYKSAAVYNFKEKTYVVELNGTRYEVNAVYDDSGAGNYMTIHIDENQWLEIYGDCLSRYPYDNEETYSIKIFDIVIDRLDNKFLDVVPVEKGGTGETTAVGAMAALGIGAANCSDAAETTTKTVSINGFKLHYGALVGVRFSNANTARSPKLNVSGTGAKNIYNTKTGEDVVSGDMGTSLHLFMYYGGAWYLLNPLK